MINKVFRSFNVGPPAPQLIKSNYNFKQMNRIKVLLLTIVSTIVLVIAVLFAKQYIQVRALPLTGNPKSFVESFNPEGQEPVSLEVGGLEGRVIHSPFLPYVKLKTQSIINSEVILTYNNGEEINKSTEGRYLNMDPFWNIYWVEISRFPEKTKFYGPFRSN